MAGAGPDVTIMGEDVSVRVAGGSGMTIANASAPGLLGAVSAEITRSKFASGIKGGRSEHVVDRGDRAGFDPGYPPDFGGAWSGEW